VTALVIACPHALGLAIPLVVAINTSLVARNGMVVYDGELIAALAMANVIRE
jgi:Cu2+-exporting ATPase